MTYFQWEQQQQQEGKNRHILLMGAAAAAGADKGTIGLGFHPEVEEETSDAERA